MVDLARLTPEVLAALTEDEKRELYELLKIKDIRAKRNRLESYKPYAKQQEFHERGLSFRERLFMAGNQLGKCRLVTSFIPLCDGRVATMGELWEEGRAFKVWAWDGERAVPAPATHLVRKGPQECVEVLLADGTTFEAALEHQVLTRAGYSPLLRLLVSAPCLPASSSALGQTAPREGDRRWFETLQGLKGGCSEGRRHGDAPLRPGEVVVQTLETSPGGARPRSPSSSPLDDLGLPRRASSGLSARDLPSSLGGRLRSWVRCAAFLARAAYTLAQSQTGTRQIVQPLLAASASLLRSLVAGLPGQGLKNVRALVAPYKAGNQIVAYRPIGRHELYDLTVPGYANYIADGLVHHNTWAGAYEMAMHLTGRYPDWWKGRRFPYAIRAMCGSESAELTRKGIQRLLIGPPEIREEWGTGTIPYDALRDTSMKQGVPDAVSSAVVRHVSGEDSVVQFNSYDQGRMQHVDSPVLTPTGWKAIGALKVGDEVIAGDGSVTVVEGVFPHGVKDLYELEFDSGVKTLAGAEHLWRAACRTNGPWKTVTTEDLIAVYGDQGGRVSGNKQYSTPNVGVVQLAAQPAPVDPYLVGALLGDGCVRGGRIRFTSNDAEIVREVARGAALLGAELVQWSDIQYGFKDAERLRREMDALGMNGLLAHEKRVPQQYMWNEPAVRMAVLQGLMDTDGSVSPKGTMSFASTSLPLAQDVAFLVRSLGGKATLRKKTDPGRKRALHHVSIRMPGEPPFRLTRKIARCVRPACETHRHILRSIRKVEPGQAVCIAVAHPSHLYVTDDFIVTHNTKWQADTVDLVWFDEEPPLPIYSEGLTRTNATGGLVFVTFTPLLGMSEVVKRYLLDKPEGTVVTNMTIDDAEHYTPEQRAAIIASYPVHEREARAKGVPILGSGRVFPIAEDAIKVTAFPIPPHWPRIVGLDFGIDHPTAAVWLAWDRDTDTVYVTDTYRVKDASIAIHAASVKARGDWIPVAWPHDGLQRDKGSGEQLAEQYRNQGLKMLRDRATFEDGSSGVEAGVSEMLTRMQTMRLRVFAHLGDWFEEFRLYHRKDGLIVKDGDDLMSATRYALMMRRFARNHEEAGARIKSIGMAPVVSFGVFDPVAGY